jgi:hypothetical protein
MLIVAMLPVMRQPTDPFGSQLIYLRCGHGNRQPRRTLGYPNTENLTLNS